MLVMVDEPGYLPCLKLAKGHPLSAIIANDKFPATADNRFAGLYYKLNMCKDDTVSLLTAGRVLEAVDGRDGRLHTGVHIVEPSATGKSRAVYECLTERYGMLLTCAPGDEYMKMGDVVWGLEQATRVTTPTARVRHYAKVVASALLARLVILRRMLKQLGSAFTPSDWLRTQLRGDVGAGAILKELSLQLQASTLSVECVLTRLRCESMGWCQAMMRMGPPFNRAMPVVIDEAQELCTASNVALWPDVVSQAERGETGRCNPYGLVTHIIHEHLVSPHSGQFVPVVAGTSFHLRALDDYAAGLCLGKEVGGLVISLLKPFARFTTVASFKSCVTSLGFGAVVDVITDEMWQFAVDELRSRGRFIATLVTEMCEGSPVLTGGTPAGPRAGAGAGGAGAGAGAGAGVGDGGGTEGCGRGDLAAASGAAFPCAACDDNAPASFNATVVNAMFREAVLRARDVVLRSRTFTRLEAKFKNGAIGNCEGGAALSRLHRALRQVALFAYMNETVQSKSMQFHVVWEEHRGVRRAGRSMGADLMAAGVAIPLDDRFNTVHVCEPIVILAVLKIVAPKLIIDHLLENWQSVAFVSPSTNGFLYELVLCDCFNRLFACMDVSAIPGLRESAWAKKWPGQWRLQDAAVLCGKVPSLSGWLKEADRRTTTASTFVLPHNNDGPDIATVVGLPAPAPAPAVPVANAAVPPGVPPPAATRTTAAAPAAPTIAPTTTLGSGVAAAVPTAPPVTGEATPGECQLIMLVQAKLRAKYHQFKHARSTVLRSTIGQTNKAADGKTWQRERIQQALKFPVVGVVIDPVSPLLEDRKRAQSSHVEFDGHTDFVWVMDKEYFDTHADIAKIFSHDIVTRLYDCATQ